MHQDVLNKYAMQCLWWHDPVLVSVTSGMLHHVWLSNFHPQARRETLRWADISTLPQTGSAEQFSPVSPMLSSSEPLILSGWVLVVA